MAVRFISMKKACEDTGWSRAFLERLDKENPEAGIIKRTGAGKVFDTVAYDKLYIGQEDGAVKRSPAPIG